MQIKRGAQVRASINLYDFLLNGSMSLHQIGNGDVIFVGPRQSMVKVSGLAENAKRFEFSRTAKPTVAELARLAKPDPKVTHVRVVRNTGTTRTYPLDLAGSVHVEAGDELEFTADKKPGTITVRVEGEHISAQEYVLPYGTRMRARQSLDQAGVVGIAPAHRMVLDDQHRIRRRMPSKEPITSLTNSSTESNFECTRICASLKTAAPGKTSCPTACGGAPRCRAATPGI